MTGRRLLAAVTAAVVAAGLISAGAAPASAAGATAQLVVAPRNAGVVGVGKPLDVDVQVRNTGSAPLPAGTLAFSLERAPAANRQQLLAEIARPSTVLLGRLTRTAVATPALQPGRTATLRARITAEDVDSILTATDGARLLYVGLRTGGGPVQTVKESAVLRVGATTPTIGFGTVVPVTAPAGTTGVVDVTAQAASTAPGGSWSEALAAARAMPSAVVALDPAVPASIRLAGTAAPATARRFLTDLAALPNPVARLPYADGDVTLQRAAGLTGSTDPASFSGAATAPAPAGTAAPAPGATPDVEATPAPSAADLTRWNWTGGRLTWPVPGTATAQDLAGAGAGPVVLDSGDVADTAARAASGPLASIRRTRVLVADADASRLLATASADGIVGEAALAPLVGALVTDALTRATPSVLAVPGRGAGAGLARALAVLAGERWIRGEDLRTMTARAAAPLQLRSGTGVPPARTALARSVVDAERGVQRLGSTAADPQAITAAPRLALLGLLSARWRGDEAGWTAAAESTRGAFGDLASRVSIVAQGVTTLGGVDGTLTVSVQNRLPQTVTVIVNAAADNGRLQFTGDPARRITVPAQTVGKVGLSLRTIANGPANVTLGLTTADGDPIGASTSRAVMVQAGFDTIVAVVLLTLLGLLLALGVYRNVTRRRRRPRIER